MALLREESLGLGPSGSVRRTGRPFGPPRRVSGHPCVARPEPSKLGCDPRRGRHALEEPMSEKMWGVRSPSGASGTTGIRLGLHRPAEGAPRDPDRAVRAGAARQRQAVRRRADVPSSQPRAPRRARVPRPHRPEEYGGLGENHVAYSMVCETIARYGCASTAMCYVMHIGAVNAIMLRQTPELVDKYIRPLNSGKIGTLSYSDPETGSHFWYPVSSGAERSNGGYRVRKKASWTTSAGFADFYVVQTTSPDFSGYDDLSVFVVDGDQVQSQPSLWDALGLRGNQSGPLEVPERRDPRHPDRRARGRRRELERRVRRPLVPDRLLVRVERARARGDRHRQAAYRPGRSTSTWACGSPTTRRSRTTWARR